MLHRLHLLPKFDYIYVLDKGEVADEGTLEDLLERRGAVKTRYTEGTAGGFCPRQFTESGS